MAVPVSEPAAEAQVSPEIILGTPEGVPRNVPKVIVIPATQLQPAKERLPLKSRERTQTTTPLPAQVNSTTTAPLHSTASLLSSSVSPTIAIPYSTITKSTIT